VSQIYVLVYLELFSNSNNEKIDNFKISKYIYEQTKVNESFSYLLKNKIISNDKNSFIYKLYNNYPYKKRLNNNVEMIDSRMNNFLEILIDGITGEIFDNKEFHETVVKISEYIEEYKNYSNFLKTIPNYKKINQIPKDIVKDQIKMILRTNFRTNLIKYRKKNSDSVCDLSINKIISSNSSKWYIEAAHIVPVAKIADKIIKRYIKKREDINELIYFDEDIRKYSNPKNGLLLPFNYHKFYDKQYFYFDSKGKIIAKQKYENLLNEFGIDINAKLIINLDNEVLNFIEERNKIYYK